MSHIAQLTRFVPALAVVGTMALAVACDSGVTSPTAPTAPSGLSPASGSTSASLTGKPPVLNICHRTEGTNEFILIRVVEAAVPAHVAHGDGAVGDPVPGLPGMVFDDSCTPIALRLSFSFADPVGDHLQLTPVRQLNPPAGVIDAVGLHFTFDNTTGDYEIILTASAANPFAGGFRIVVVLFNPDTGTTAQNPAFFSALNDFFLTTPTTAITLTGSDPKLLTWEAGDRVAACQGTSFVEFGPCLGGLGLPDGIAGFATGVITFTTPPPFGSAKGLDFFFSAPPATIGH